MSNDPREAMRRRFEAFRFECPNVGEDLPDLSGRLLDGGEWRSSEFRGKALVLETGSFT